MRNHDVEQEEHQQTNYPYTKQQIKNLFKREPQKGEHIFGTEEAYPVIETELNTMKNYGYDIKQKRWKFPEEPQNKNFMKIERKVRLRFECSNCVENGKKKRWTSYLGTALIKFKLININDFLREQNVEANEKFTLERIARTLSYPKILIWSVEFFKMQCRECKGWGEAFIFSSQLEPLGKELCRIVSQILEFIPRPKIIERDPDEPEGPPTHIISLCEACSKGLCFVGDKKNVERIKEIQNKKLGIGNETRTYEKKYVERNNRETFENKFTGISKNDDGESQSKTLLFKPQISYPITSQPVLRESLQRESQIHQRQNERLSEKDKDVGFKEKLLNSFCSLM